MCWCHRLYMKTDDTSPLPPCQEIELKYPGYTNAGILLI